MKNNQIALFAPFSTLMTLASLCNILVSFDKIKLLIIRSVRLIFCQNGSCDYLNPSWDAQGMSYLLFNIHAHVNVKKRMWTCFLTFLKSFLSLLLFQNHEL